MLREMGLHLLPPLQAPQLEPAAPAVPAHRADESVARRAPVSVHTPAGEAAEPAFEEFALDSLGWDELRAAAEALAGHGDTQRRLVFGSGPRAAEWMVIGDVPGESEEQQGVPFAGTSGRLMDNMLRAMGLDRERDVYLTNLLKCRPPGDRNPEPGELAQWEPFLRREVALVQPRMIVLMGRFAVPRVLQTQEPIGRLRGRMHAYQGVPVVVTYHPAYLLRNLPDKARAWADLCLAQAAWAATQEAASGR